MAVLQVAVMARQHASREPVLQTFLSRAATWFNQKCSEIPTLVQVVSLREHPCCPHRADTHFKKDQLDRPQDKASTATSQFYSLAFDHWPITQI